MVALPRITQVKQAVDLAIQRSQDYFRRTQYPEGYWWGELESNPTMEAEYLLLTHFLGRLEYRGEFIPGHGSPWLDWPSHFPFFMNQARGGLLFIGAFSLWSARRALREALSWKSGATWGLLLGMLFLWGWVTALGIPPLLSLIHI